jgi:hypothetical protein
LDRQRALLYSLAATVLFNVMAGVVTIAYANGSTIVETNPSSTRLLDEFGAFGILVRAVQVASVYSLAYLLSRAISSRSRILSAKRIYLFSFTFLITVLAAASFADLLGDLLVVAFGSNLLAGADRILAFGLAVAVPFASLQVARRWSLP